ncbi:hypothetical protein AALF15_01085 [Corynebacteriaceae bacterium 7-707]
MNIKRTALAVAMGGALAITACSGDAEADPVDEAVERCQNEVVDYAKYPGSVEWVEIHVAEEQNGKIYVNGGADANNDAGNPVRVNYSCTLDTDTDEWADAPSMEPKEGPGGSQYRSGERWAGEQSPMLEKYGDRMSMESDTAQDIWGS